MNIFNIFNQTKAPEKPSEMNHLELSDETGQTLLASLNEKKRDREAPAVELRSVSE